MFVPPELPHVADTITRSVSTKRKREESGMGSPPKQPRFAPDITSSVVELSPLTQTEVEKNETSRKFTTLLSVEKRQNQEFEDYLLKVLDDDFSVADTNTSVNLLSSTNPSIMSMADTPRQSQGGATRRRTSLPSMWTPSLAAYKTRTMVEEPVLSGSQSTLLNISVDEIKNKTLTDSVKMLNNGMEAQKNADKMFEMKLQSYLTEIPDFVK